MIELPRGAELHNCGAEIGPPTVATPSGPANVVTPYFICTQDDTEPLEKRRIAFVQLDTVVPEHAVYIDTAAVGNELYTLFDLGVVGEV